MLDSPATTPTGRAEHPWLRAAIGMLLLVNAGIHTYEAFTADTAILAAGFVGATAGLIAGALLLLARAPRLGWSLGGLVALLTLIGYLVTRSTAVPGDNSDVGNWTEPLGLVSLVLEGTITAAAVWALTGPEPLRRRHLVAEAKAGAPRSAGGGARRRAAHRPAPGASK